MSHGRQNLEALATSLRNAVVAMRAFTDQQGNMPEDTGEFRDLKAALFYAEAALLTMPDDALNKRDTPPEGSPDPGCSGCPGGCADEPMPAGYYADMIALEVMLTGAVSSTFYADLEDEQWLVTVQRIGCGECGGAE